MKPSIPESEIIVDKTADEPIVSFSHLSFSLASEEMFNDNQGTVYGFPAAEEEDLYETGYLMKIFLRC